MNKKLLIIDDESTFRMFLRDIFESRGCSITTASNGQEGLQYAREDKFDVIITDMVMPETTGTELIAELRKGGNDTPIIAITGHSDGEAGLALAKEYKVDCVVYKPFFAKELYDAVDAAINNRKLEPVQG